MANEDVLERMKRFLNPESPMYRSEGRQIMEALAAALREARERNEGMRAELHRIVGHALDRGGDLATSGRPSGPALLALTEMIDAAMKPPGGESDQ